MVAPLVVTGFKTALLDSLTSVASPNNAPEIRNHTGLRSAFGRLLIKTRPTMTPKFVRIPSHFASTPSPRNELIRSLRVLRARANGHFGSVHAELPKIGAMTAHRKLRHSLISAQSEHLRPTAAIHLETCGSVRRRLCAIAA